MAKEIYQDCPSCGSEILVTLEYQESEPDVNVQGGYFWDESPPVMTCACTLSDKEKMEIIAGAELAANEDPGDYGDDDFPMWLEYDDDGQQTFDRNEAE
jgi:hypothetical protein